MRFQLRWGAAILSLGAATSTFAADPPPAWAPPTPVWTTLPTRPAQARPPADAPKADAPKTADAPKADAAPSPMPVLTPAPYPAPMLAGPATSAAPLLIGVPANSVRENFQSTCAAYTTAPTVAPVAMGAMGAMGAPCAAPPSVTSGVGLPSLGLRARLASLGGGLGTGACAARLQQWLCYQPGPAVIPACAPEPYEAPPRAFFLNRTHGGGCQPGGCGQGAPAGGCAPALGGRLGALLSGGTARPFAGSCGAGGACGSVSPNLASTLGLDGGCGPDGCALVKHKGLGACAVPSLMAPTTGEVACQLQSVGVPLPETCVGNNVASDCLGGCDAVGSACRRGCGTSMLSRLTHRSRDCYAESSAPPGFVPTSVTPVITGYVVNKPAARYRYADPLNAAGTSPSGVVPNTATPGTQIDAIPQSMPTGSQPSAPGSAPTAMPGSVVPMGYKAPAEAKPFSRP